MNLAEKAERRAEVVKLWEQGLSQGQIAAKLNITQQWVSAVLKSHYGMPASFQRRIASLADGCDEVMG